MCIRRVSLKIRLNFNPRVRLCPRLNFNLRFRLYRPNLSMLSLSMFRLRPRRSYPRLNLSMLRRKRCLLWNPCRLRLLS